MSSPIFSITPSAQSQTVLAANLEYEDALDGFESTTTETTTTDTTTTDITTPTSPEGLEIWKGMPPDDLFDLTMVSEEYKQNVQTLRLGITRITFNDKQLLISVANRDFDNEETNIDIELVGRIRLPGKLKLITSYLSSKIWRKVLSRNINGVEYEVEKVQRKEGVEVVVDGVTFRCNQYNRRFTIYTTDTASAYIDLFKHLFCVFPNPAPLYCLDLRGIRTENFDVPTELLNYEQIRKCACLAIAIRKNEFVGQAHRTLEMMSELRNLNLDIGLMDTEFFSPKMCVIDHINVSYHKNQISAENLTSLNCETIKLWSVTTTASALNSFIKKWMNSKERRFQFLEIPILYLAENDKNVSDITKDLEVKSYDEMMRAPFYKRYDWNFDVNCIGRYRHINCKNGMDIKREDGLMATIIPSSTFFYFLVWHDRFPEQPNNHVPYCDS